MDISNLLPPILRSRNFALLWFGGLISLTGDWMLRIALPAYVYTLTGSTLATGVMFMVSTVPRILLGSMAGVFVDRWRRQRLMVAVNILLAIVLLPLLLVRSTDLLWLVYAIAFVQSLLAQFFSPAENALLPDLVGEEQLLAANAMNALNNNLARLVGPALGGFLAVTIDLAGVALVDAATYLTAAILIALIRHRDEPTIPGPHQAAATSFRVLWVDWAAGIRLVRERPRLSLLFAIAAVTALGEGVLSVLFIPFVTDVLRGEALELGWLMSAQAVGGILGGVLLARLGDRLQPLRILGPSAILFALIDLAIFNYPTFFPGFLIALILMIVVGFPAAGFGASFSTLLQQAVSNAYRGRIFGALNTTIALIMLAGMGLASVAGDLAGIVPMINIQGYAYLAAGLLALRLRRRTAQHDHLAIPGA